MRFHVPIIRGEDVTREFSKRNRETIVREKKEKAVLTKARGLPLFVKLYPLYIFNLTISTLKLKRQDKSNNLPHCEILNLKVTLT